MNKLKLAVFYELANKMPYVGLFYLIQYAGLAVILIIDALISPDEAFNIVGLETGTVIFIIIIGTLAYKDDFNTLLQNGYNRKYIFLSDTLAFAAITAAMAFIDTVISAVFELFEYHFSVVSLLYGSESSENFILHWLYLTVVYLLLCVLFKFFVMLANLQGKKQMLVALIIFIAGIAIISTALSIRLLSEEMRTNLTDFISKSFGFMYGEKNLISPIISMLCILLLLQGVSYAIIRRTEIK